jgi:hypothetical protein
VRRLLVVAASIALALAAAAPAALAHGGNSNFRSVIDRVTPEVEGVEVNVRNYDAEFELVVRDGNRVLLYGYEDEPYARVLADGTVQVNQRSPAAYLNEDRYAASRVPAAADASAPPRWKTVDGSGTFVFHDHRMHYMATGTPPRVKDEAVKTKVFDYRVPIRIDGEAGAITGTLWWVGPEDTSKLPFAIAGIAVVLLGGLAVVLVRRRRGGEAPADTGKEAW